MALICSQAISTPLLAQSLPDAGSSLRDLQTSEPAIPDRDDQVVISLPQDSQSQAMPSDIFLTVRSFRLEGNQAIESEVLYAQLEDLLDRKISLAELATATDRITQVYHVQGYLLSRAFLPAQEISEDQGEVIIQVLEGRYGDITLENNSLLRDTVLQKRLEGLEQDSIVDMKPLEERLLLIDDLPGIALSTRMGVGSRPGTANLEVFGEPTERFTGVISLDDQGSESTGKYRLRASTSVNSPLGLGDRLNLDALYSDEGQLFYLASYDLPVSERFGISLNASRMDYELSGAFSNLDASGTAETLGLGVRYHFKRSRLFNLQGRFVHEVRDLEDKVGAFDLVTTKKVHDSVLSLSGDWRDQFFGSAVNAFSLSYIFGDVRLGQEGFQAETPRGSFNKFELSAIRLQSIADRLDLYMAMRGQITQKNLDSSEKIMLSGPNGVRAYPLGEASGDEGVLMSFELRYRMTNQLQVKTFADVAYSKLIDQPFNDDDNYRHLSGVGVGLDWRSNEGFGFSLEAATRSGERPVSAEDDDIRIWSSVSWYF